MPRRLRGSIPRSAPGWSSPGTASVTAATARFGAGKRCWVRPGGGAGPQALGFSIFPAATARRVNRGALLRRSCGRAEKAGCRQSSADFIAEAWRKRVNVVPTSSVGRLFDAAAALILGLEQASFEGQGPMMLESLAAGTSRSRELPLSRDAAGLLRVDWSPLLEDLADQSRPPAERAAMFHESLAHALVQQVLELRRQARFDAVGLAGGVFQNRRLSERVIERLGEMGIPVFLATAVPANDGGLAFGQAIEALHILLSQSG